MYIFLAPPTDRAGNTGGFFRERESARGRQTGHGETGKKYRQAMEKQVRNTDRQ